MNKVRHVIPTSILFKVVLPGNLLRKKELPSTSIAARLASYNILEEDEIKPAAEFIGRCLRLEYSNRPTSEELSDDDWLAGWVCGSC